MKKYYNAAFVLIISLIILIPMFFFNFKKEQISTFENRNLAEFPTKFNGFSNYMSGIDAYVKDRAGFRDGMMQLYNEVLIGKLKSHHKQVIFGEDGWLFYNEELPDYTGTNIEQEKIEKCVDILKGINEWCESRGSKFVFIVGPNKSSIYSEYMPDYIKKADVSFLDILTERLNQEGVPIINPKQELIKNKNKTELYYKLDTHWNSLGAKYALDRLVDEFDLEPKEFEITTHRQEWGDLLNMLAVKSVNSESLITDVKPDPNTVVEKFENSQDQKLISDKNKKFVCYRDSYSISLQDFYTHYFDGYMYWSFNLLNEMEKEPCDYVIFECVERYLETAIFSCEDILQK